MTEMFFSEMMEIHDDTLLSDLEYFQQILVTNRFNSISLKSSMHLTTSNRRASGLPDFKYLEGYKSFLENMTHRTKNSLPVDSKLERNYQMSFKYKTAF